MPFSSMCRIEKDERSVTVGTSRDDVVLVHVMVRVFFVETCSFRRL